MQYKINFLNYFDEKRIRVKLVGVLNTPTNFTKIDTKFAGWHSLPYLHYEVEKAR